MDNIIPIETPNVYMIRAYTDENSYFAFGLYVNAEDANKACDQLMESGRYRRTEISNISTENWDDEDVTKTDIVDAGFTVDSSTLKRV